MGSSEQQVGAIFDGGTALGLGSAGLLERFAAGREPSTFEAIVAHHGPMVLATCRRVLPNATDADDAFQATFLVLARKATAIRNPDRLAPWLHQVAHRVALRARTQSARRRRVEGAGQGEVAVAPIAADGELRAVLDEELARLPAKYRDPLVLCYLDGMTHDEAASQLAWPVGTVRSRLAGGRDRLRSRLARRGFAPGALAVLSPASLPKLAVSRLLQAATVRLVCTSGSGKAATSAALLAQGVLTSMFLAKVQTAALATLAVAATLATGTAGVVMAQSNALTPTEARPAAAARPAAEASAPPSALVDQPTRAVTDLADELEAAKARIKALEAELATVRSEDPPQPPTTPTAPEPPVAARTRPRAGGVATASRAGTDIQVTTRTTPATPEPPRATSLSSTTYTTNTIAAAPATPTPPTPPTSSWTEAQKAAYFGSWTKPLVGNRVLISPAERDRVMVVDTRSGKKFVYSDPANLKKIVPAYVDNLVGLYLEGPQVKQVVAFSILDNAWSTQPLHEPLTNGNVGPILGQNMVRYLVGRYLYVFSPEANRWGVLEMKQEATGQALPKDLINTEDGMILPEGDVLHAYNTHTGEWTHINIKEDK